MLEPKTVSIKCLDGTEKEFVISKFPALVGREVVTQYPTTAAPKVGDYQRNEELLLKMMSYVAAITPGGEIKLTTRELVNNHVPDYEALMRLEAKMLEYNTSFFNLAGVSTLLGGIEGKARELITQMLTLLSQQSQAPASQNSTSLKRSTRSKKR